SSDSNGNPVLARPFFDNQAGAPAAYLDSFPGLLSGGVSVAARTALQGFQLNLTTNLYRDSSIGLDLLAGFRFLQLNEDLVIFDNVTALVPGQLTFLGAPADPPSSLAIRDGFHNYNTFYGGQIGARFAWCRNGLDLGITGKLALGTTQQLVLTEGS